MKRVINGIILLAVLFGLTTCGDKSAIDLLYPVSKDKELGMQLRDEIAKNPSEYPVVPRSQAPEAYKYLELMRDKILASDDVRYKDEFAWEIYIIDQDVLNAFAAPGGYIYVYTGLIDYLDNESDLAGVLGHEIAHADQRHSINQMVKQYGVQLLLDIALGKDQSKIKEVTGGLVGLKFSRSDESEADEFSVNYLCPTDYKGNGAAEFFRKLEEEGQSSGVPEFLSTHPSPENRVENIDNLSKELSCEGTCCTNKATLLDESGIISYQELQDMF
ncbi:MAG: M48 family metalloprotease [Cytophagales bacterium]|nr:M48 family metalloprotease [Cytophagales bacterium]